MEDQQQTTFSGWGVVEMMGHRREIGYISTDYFGGVALFRVDTPELPEREYTLTAPEYVGGSWIQAGAKVKREASPARSCLVAPSALYALNPCSETAARTALEKVTQRPLILIEAPPAAAIVAPETDDDDDELFDDREPYR